MCCWLVCYHVMLLIRFQKYGSVHGNNTNKSKALYIDIDKYLFQPEAT